MSSVFRKKDGVPKNAISRELQKKVKFPIAKSAAENTKPSWRFSTVDKGGPFAWPIGANEELAILEKLHSFDSMEWSKIPGPDHHAIPVDKLSDVARNRLVELNRDDIEEIFSFHFSGKKRIIGIREYSLVKLLWWDPNHQVCPSLKKHT